MLSSHRTSRAQKDPLAKCRWEQCVQTQTGRAKRIHHPLEAGTGMGLLSSVGLDTGEMTFGWNPDVVSRCGGIPEVQNGTVLPQRLSSLWPSHSPLWDTVSLYG